MIAIRIGYAVAFAPDVASLKDLVDRAILYKPFHAQAITERDAAITRAVLEQRGVPK